jgi:hypothetical protein
MLRPGESLSLLLLTLGLLVPRAAACGLEHCPRPKVRAQEAPSVAWGLQHKRLGGESGDGRYTEGALHVRRPLGSRWRLGAHLPFGYLATVSGGRWGLGNPMAYAEAAWGPPASAARAFEPALTAGLQLELPLGDAAAGIASGHPMAMPYATLAFPGTRLTAHASLGLAARLDALPGVHGQADRASAGHVHAGHTPDQHAAADLPAPLSQANPHAPYELLFRAGLSLPLPSRRLEPEIALYGARVLFTRGDPGALTPMAGSVALAVRAGRGLVVKPRWERSLASPGRFAWSTGVDLKLDLPGWK